MPRYIAIKRLLAVMITAAAVTGCTQTLDAVNEGAESVGRTSGQVLNIPNSVNEGMTDGVLRDKDESDPYDRNKKKKPGGEGP